MKVRLLVLATMVVVTGCSLFSSPQATVKKFMAAAQKGDVETMNSLFSKRAIERDGSARIGERNQQFAELGKKTDEGRPYVINYLTESTEGANARVAFTYQRRDRNDSARVVFALSKESGAWKIDNIGGVELEQISDLASPALKDPPVRKPEPSVTAPAITVPDAPPAPNSHAPISGGVLNSKAISLPQPAYPAIGKQVKAHGTVVVQVTVDENGNVISAHAISGHPLLLATSVAAARAAKFSPTRLSGQAVKVNGVINYNFEAPAN